jgi:hypothetical protein
LSSPTPINAPTCSTTTTRPLCSPTISTVEEPGVKKTNSHGKSHDLLLQLSNIPIWPRLKLDLLGDVTSFVFNGSKFGVVRWPRDDIKTTRTRTCSDGCVYVRAVVCGQIIPDKNAIVIGYGNAIDLNIITNVLAEILKRIVDVPMFLTHLIHCQGCLILPYTCGGSIRSPGSIANRTVSFLPCP